MKTIEIQLEKEDINKSINDLLIEKEIKDLPQYIKINIDVMTAAELDPNFNKKTKEEFIDYVLNELAMPIRHWNGRFNAYFNHRRISDKFLTRENVGICYDEYIGMNDIEDLDNYYVIENDK